MTYPQFGPEVTTTLTTDTGMNTETTARYIGCTAAAMRLWRRTGQGPLYYKLGKLVRYRKNDIDDWLARHAVDANR
jgi:predicted DNA-binding transcriptional regulator AlpA